MVLLRNTAEGQSSGTTLTAANSGGGSGDAFSTVYKQNGATVAFTSSQGVHNGINSYVFGATSSGSSQYANLIFTPGASSKLGAIQAYYYFTTYPTSGSIHTVVATNGGGSFLNITISSTGVLRLADFGPGGTSSPSSTVPLNTLIRLDIQFAIGTTGSDGQAKIQLSTGDGAAIWSSSASSLNFGTTAVSAVQYGIIGAYADMSQFYMDDIAYQDSATDYIPPYVLPTAAAWLTAPVTPPTVAAATSGFASPGVLLVPTGVVNGSLVVISYFQPTAGGDFTNVTPPSGFVEAYHNSLYTGGFYFTFGWFYKYATGSDSGNYTFTTTEAWGAGIGYVFRVTGGPTTGNPFVDTFRDTSSMSATTTASISSFTPSGDSSLLLSGVGVNGTVTPPSGWVIDVSDTGAMAAHFQQLFAAPTGTLTWSWTATSTYTISIATIRAK